jgi:hypothetical protein
VSARELARIRALWTELGQALDVAEAEVAHKPPRARKAPRARRALLPETMPSQSVIDDVARTLRRKGFSG